MKFIVEVEEQEMLFEVNEKVYLVDMKNGESVSGLHIHQISEELIVRCFAELLKKWQQQTYSRTGEVLP